MINILSKNMLINKAVKFNKQHIRLLQACCSKQFSMPQQNPRD